VAHRIPDVVGTRPEDDVGRLIWAGSMECSPRHVLDQVSSYPAIDPAGKVVLEERGVGGAREPFPVGVPE